MSSNSEFDCPRTVALAGVQKGKARRQLKPQERKKAASITRKKYMDRTPTLRAFFVVLNDARCFENQEAAMVYYKDFLKKVFVSHGSHLKILRTYRDLFNGFIVAITKAEGATLEELDEVDHVVELIDIFVGWSHPQFSATKPSLLLEDQANKDLVENSNSGKEEKCKTKMDSKDEEPGCQLFLVRLKVSPPLKGKCETDAYDYELYHKQFVKRVTGRELASKVKMVRSYPNFLNAFVLEVEDTMALTWRELFTLQKKVQFVLDLKQK